MMLVREIVPLTERCAAAARVEAWGYPRRVSDREIDHARWYTSGDAIVWFDAPPEYAQAGVMAVHGIGEPQRKRQVLTSEAEGWICTKAAELGARKLYSLIPRETPNMPVKAMRRYLRRYGWVEDEFGSYKLLGGE